MSRADVEAPAPWGDTPAPLCPASTLPAPAPLTAPADDVPASWVVGFAGAAVVAAAAAMAPDGLRPFTTARWPLMAVALALAVAVAPGPRRRLPRVVLVLGGGFLGWMALATALALEPLSAIAGHPRRHLGLAGWAACALALLAGASLHRRDVTRHLARAVVVAAVVTGTAAAADLAGWGPAGVTFAGGRVGGLTGQPTYLGALAVLLAPVAAGVAWDRDAGRAWRVAAAIGAAGCALALVASGTRGAWVGALVAVAVWAAARRGTGAYRTARPHRWVAVAAGIAVGIVILAGPVGGRLASAGDGLGARLDEWAVAVRVVADHPLTGVGPEGYRIAAPAHIDDAYTRRHGRDEFVDRAHNGPLDVAVSGGVPAAGLYVALLALVVTAAVRALRHPAHPVLAGAAAGLIAWVTQQLASFPIAEVDPVAWLLAGALMASGARPTPLGRPPRGHTATRAVAGVMAVALAVGGVRAAQADRELARADRLAADGYDAAAVAAADRATRLRPDDVDAWYVAARIAADRPGLLSVDAGLDRVEAGRARLPLDPALQDLEEALLVERALRSGLPEDLRAAEDASRRAIAADPASPAHHRRLGQVLAASGERERAAAALRRALDLAPGDPVAREALAEVEGPQ